MVRPPWKDSADVRGTAGGDGSEQSSLPSALSKALWAERLTVGVTVHTGSHPATPSPVLTASVECTRTHDFWMTHPDDWPVESLAVGEQDYDTTQLLEILDAPPSGDPTLILAHQLIAAKLNQASGADASKVADAIGAADTLLGGFEGRLPHDIDPSSEDGVAAVELATNLEGYNTGEIGPGPCDIDPSPPETAEVPSLAPGIEATPSSTLGPEGTPTAEATGSSPPESTETPTMVATGATPPPTTSTP